RDDGSHTAGMCFGNHFAAVGMTAVARQAGGSATAPARRFNGGIPYETVLASAGSVFWFAQGEPIHQRKGVFMEETAHTQAAVALGHQPLSQDARLESRARSGASHTGNEGDVLAGSDAQHGDTG